MLACKSCEGLSRQTPVQLRGQTHSDAMYVVILSGELKRIILMISFSRMGAQKQPSRVESEHWCASRKGWSATSTLSVCLEFSALGLLLGTPSTSICAYVLCGCMDTLRNGLEKYTLHSTRVGACVLLYEMGKSATFIKDCLLDIAQLIRVTNCQDLLLILFSVHLI